MIVHSLRAYLRYGFCPKVMSLFAISIFLSGVNNSNSAMQDHQLWSHRHHCKVHNNLDFIYSLNDSIPISTFTEPSVDWNLFYKVPNLLRLDYCRTPIRNISGIEIIAKFCPNLRVVDLKYCGLTEVSEKSLLGLSSLPITRM